MDSRLTVGDKIDLETIENRISADPDAKPVVYVSQVLDETPNNEVMAAMPFQEGKLVPLAVGQRFNSTFYTKSGLLQCVVEVTGRYKKGSFFMMELSQKTEFKKVQRRQYFRLECTIPLVYRNVGDEEMANIEKGLFDYEPKPAEWKKGVVLDISGGGIRFASGDKEEKQHLIQVKFDLDINDETEEFCIFATVLRSQVNKNKNSIYEQRIMFWNLDQSMREKLIRGIFELQRKKRSLSSGIK